jgi:hypothetical protein
VLGDLTLGAPLGGAPAGGPAPPKRLGRLLPSGPDGWRRAVIAAEVLAPPLALRRSWPGSPAA